MATTNSMDQMQDKDKVKSDQTTDRIHDAKADTPEFNDRSIRY